MLTAHVSQQMLIGFLILTKIYYDNLPTDGSKVSFTASFIGSK